MAGLSQRFTDAGYKVPKYMLDANGKTLFEHSLLSFEKYFQTNSFTFVARNVNNTIDFIREKCNKLGILNFEIVSLESKTSGQAETVLRGLDVIQHECPILIFNIDTFRPNYTFPKEILNWDGYLEVFEGSGKNWSYAKPLNSSSTNVIETAEKKEISNLCSTGLYFFRSKSLFMDSYSKMNSDDLVNNERYIAPLYNSIITEGHEIHYNKILREEVIFCGTPDEYNDFLKNDFLSKL